MLKAYDLQSSVLDKIHCKRPVVLDLFMQENRGGKGCLLIDLSFLE